MTRELFKRKSFWIAVPLVLVIAGAVLAIFASSREPRYHGKALSYWIDGLPTTIALPNRGALMTYDMRVNSLMSVQIVTLPGLREKATNAVNELGEKCLPYLMIRLRARDSALKIKCSVWAVRLGLKEVPWRQNNFLTEGQAVTALVMLGGRAQGVVPQLRKLAKDKDPFIRDQANHILAKIEKPQLKLFDGMSGDNSPPRTP